MNKIVLTGFESIFQDLHINSQGQITITVDVNTARDLKNWIEEKLKQQSKEDPT